MMKFKQHELQAIAEMARKEANKYERRLEGVPDAERSTTKYIVNLSNYRLWETIKQVAITEFINYNGDD